MVISIDFSQQTRDTIGLFQQNKDFVVYVYIYIYIHIYSIHVAELASISKYVTKVTKVYGNAHTENEVELDQHASLTARTCICSFRISINICAQLRLMISFTGRLHVDIHRDCYLLTFIHYPRN